MGRQVRAGLECTHCLQVWSVLVVHSVSGVCLLYTRSLQVWSVLVVHSVSACLGCVVHSVSAGLECARHTLGLYRSGVCTLYTQSLQLWNVLVHLVSAGLECEKLTDFYSKESVKKALRTPLASMQYGNEEFLADLVAEACSKGEKGGGEGRENRRGREEGGA